MFTNGKVPVFVNRELLKSEPISEACLRQKNKDKNNFHDESETTRRNRNSTLRESIKEFVCVMFLSPGRSVDCTLYRRSRFLLQ